MKTKVKPNSLKLIALEGNAHSLVGPPNHPYYPQRLRGPRTLLGHSQDGACPNPVVPTTELLPREFFGTFDFILFPG
jgi:hypothetical protein